MCSSPKWEPCSADSVVEGGVLEKNLKFDSFSILLEFSASDDLIAFRKAVAEEGYDINKPAFWYGSRIASKKMGFVERTPLMIASMFGSKQVLNYILQTGLVDVNRACGSDGATALHCAVAGAAPSSPEVVKLLVDASADVNSIDVDGNRPADLISGGVSFCFNSRRQTLMLILDGCSNLEEACLLADQIVERTEEKPNQQLSAPLGTKDGSEKKEYPIVDPSLPDIKMGIYGTDEFRMYTFKVKPCSRAYSHDWTECPFVHPGENARRRDPRKYHYSCVPCPEFRKGACQKGDACEYAHGIFECWLHPAQYRTRLCKDETNCNRRVCFFAHNPEELRPSYASTGSAVSSPRSFSTSAFPFDIASISPLALAPPSAIVPPTSAPPMTSSGSSSPRGGSMWLNQPNLAPPALQLPGSRLKTALNARDIDLDAEFLRLESHGRLQQQLIDEIPVLSPPSGWNNSLAAAMAFAASSGDRIGELNRLAGVKSTDMDDIFGSLDPTVLPRLGLSLDAASMPLQSPRGLQIQQNMNHHLGLGYPSNISSSPVRASLSVGTNTPRTAGAALNLKSAAFAKRSQSFIDRSNHHSGLSSPVSAAAMMPSALSDWASPDGKLDWSIRKEESSKLRKSASFGLWNSASSFATAAACLATSADEPDASGNPSLVKDGQAVNFGSEKLQHHVSNAGSEMLPQWVEQLYMEQEQMVA